MKLLWLNILLGLSLSAPIAAHAQVGIYGTFDAARVMAASPGTQQTTAWSFGPAAGIYYDFLHLGPMRLGADLRGDLLEGGQKYRSALFGLRLAAKLPVISLTPYVQGAVGVGGAAHSGLGGVGTIYSNKFQYQILGGLDCALAPHIDLRLAEVGYARMSGISSAPDAPVATVLTISSGIVFRLP
jgi:hypothetical protein